MICDLRLSVICRMDPYLACLYNVCSQILKASVDGGGVGRGCLLVKRLQVCVCHRQDVLPGSAVVIVAVDGE